MAFTGGFKTTDDAWSEGVNRKVPHSASVLPETDNTYKPDNTAPVGVFQFPVPRIDPGSRLQASDTTNNKEPQPKEDTPKVCPCCGRCPVCGQVPPQPIVIYNPFPQYPYYVPAPSFVQEAASVFSSLFS